MKRLLTSLSILALIATSSTFISCSSDDNVTKEVELSIEQQILGKWILGEIDLKMQLGDNVITDEVGTDVTNELDLYFEFKVGNVVTLYQKQYQNGEVTQGTGTYTVSGSQLTVNISGTPQVFEYEINGDKLSLTLNVEEMYEGQLLIMNLTYHLYK